MLLRVSEKYKSERNYEDRDLAIMFLEACREFGIPHNSPLAPITSVAYRAFFSCVSSLVDGERTAVATFKSYKIIIARCREDLPSMGPRKGVTPRKGTLREVESLPEAKEIFVIDGERIRTAADWRLSLGGAGVDPRGGREERGFRLACFQYVEARGGTVAAVWPDDTVTECCRSKNGSIYAKPRRRGVIIYPHMLGVTGGPAGPATAKPREGGA